MVDFSWHCATPMITRVARTGSNVTLEFTSTDGTDTPASFKLQSSSIAASGYAEDGSATITQLPNGTISAIANSGAAAQFYRIRKLRGDRSRPSVGSAQPAIPG